MLSKLLETASQKSLTYREQGEYTVHSSKFTTHERPRGVFLWLKTGMRLIIGNPYDYNAVVRKQTEHRKEQQLMPGPEMMQTNPKLNMVGKFLGLDTAKEWSQYYDKIFDLYTWAEEKTKSGDVNKIISFLQDKLNASPSMSDRRINDLHVFYKLDLRKPEKKEAKPEVKTEAKKEEPKKEDPIENFEATEQKHYATA